MSSKFYQSIIEEEINFFNIKNDSLKHAAKAIQLTYNPKSLENGNTFIDYNMPSNRCAYLYKYADIHTHVVFKYFTKMLRNKQIKTILKKREHIKISCLGGGPGTDIVGLFKAMALNPYFHKKVVEVTILDICGGWRNSFNRVIKNIVSGKVKNIPSTFIDEGSFHYKLIEVDLLNSLSSAVVRVLSEADIICMVKFVSAILGYPTSISAIQNIGLNFKKEAVVLFIDNFRGNVFEYLTNIAEQIGLQEVVGPLHDRFDPKTGGYKAPVSTAKKEMFGCLPLIGTKVSAIAFIKISLLSRGDLLHNIYTPNSNPSSVKSQDVDIKYETELIIPKSLAKASAEIYSKSTQTDFASSSQDCSDILTGLGSLFESLIDLVNVLNELQQEKVFKSTSYCHCCS